MSEYISALYIIKFMIVHVEVAELGWAKDRLPHWHLDPVEMDHWIEMYWILNYWESQHAKNFLWPEPLRSNKPQQYRNSTSQTLRRKH